MPQPQPNTFDPEKLAAMRAEADAYEKAMKELEASKPRDPEVIRARLVEVARLIAEDHGDSKMSPTLHKEFFSLLADLFHRE